MEQTSLSMPTRPAFPWCCAPRSWWRHPFRREISGLNIKLSRKGRWLSFVRPDHLTFWLAFLALETPIFGFAWIGVYAFATPGKHGIYLSVGMLTAIAAFLIGVLIGFLFGIPKVISSGQARLGQSSGYAPSSNLSEVSDWLTKLLLGAGLVQLTHLGAPIGALINHIAAGLHTHESVQRSCNSRSRNNHLRICRTRLAQWLRGDNYVVPEKARPAEPLSASGLHDRARRANRDLMGH